MIFESLAIIAIVLAMAFIFLRTKKKVYAVGLLPLVIMPVVEILIKPISALVTNFFNVRSITVAICMIFIALIVESILLGILASFIESKKQRTLFLVMCGAFTLVLAMIFILQAMKTYLNAVAVGTSAAYLFNEIRCLL